MRVNKLLLLHSELRKLLLELLEIFGGLLSVTHIGSCKLAVCCLLPLQVLNLFPEGVSLQRLLLQQVGELCVHLCNILGRFLLKLLQMPLQLGYGCLRLAVRRPDVLLNLEQLLFQRSSL